MPSFSLFHLRPRDLVHGNVVSEKRHEESKSDTYNHRQINLSRHFDPCIFFAFFFLLKEIRFLHSPVVLGQLDRKDDAGDEEHYAPSQTEPEGILKREQAA